MKKIFIAVILIVSLNVTAQTQFKNMCLDKACAGDIIKVAGVTKLLKVDDMESNYLINVYNVSNEDELQLWYTDGTKELKRIVAPYNELLKIYQQYFGRAIDAEKILKDEMDKWKATFNNKIYEIRLTKMDRESYWRLDIFER